MKNISSIIVLLLFVFIGISGCAKQTTEQDGKENEQPMLTYLNEKYNTEFTTVEYIPAKRGFNDSMNQNILVAESEDGLRVEVRETVSNPGKYMDTYLNAYAAKLISNKFNYNSITNIQFAKTYINLRSREVSLEDLQKDNFVITNDMVINFSSIISILGDVSEEALVELYDVYTEQVALGYKRNVFVASFGGDPVKSEKYVNSYAIYGIRNWEVYDESVKAVIVVTANGLSYEEFRHRVIYR
ncbi:hypothetical protein [Sutcliffiella cohnii]|uniref:hypothetical protein n=1 Tax=Sutcliffiella cohnii TaxID=33932 RepID=UPI002E1C2D86|nr:hypothetical protein [Sutcliffiella cohnii]